MTPESLVVRSWRGTTLVRPGQAASHFPARRSVVAAWYFFCAGMDGEKRDHGPFDAPVLIAVHATARPILDTAFLLISSIGYGLGLVPFDVLFTMPVSGGAASFVSQKPGVINAPLRIN